MTEQTAAAELQLNEWVHPRTGETRRYVQNWPELIGLEIARYNTGNISGAWLNGEKIPNNRAGSILAVKVWLDENDEIHVDNVKPRVEAYIHGYEIKEAVAAAYVPPTAAEQAEKTADELVKSTTDACKNVHYYHDLYQHLESEGDTTTAEWALAQATVAEHDMEARLAEFLTLATDYPSETICKKLGETTRTVREARAVAASAAQIVDEKPASQDDCGQSSTTDPEVPESETPAPVMPTTLPAVVDLDVLRTIKELEAKTDRLNLRAGDVITMADGMDQFLAWGDLTQAAGDLLDTLATLPRHGRVERLEERLRAMEARYLREETTIVTDATRRFPEYLAAGPEAARYTSETIAHKANVLVETTMAGIDQADANRDNPRGFQTQIMIAHIRANLLRFDCEQLAALWFINPEQALRDRYTTLRDQVRATHLRLVEANSGPDRLFLNKFAFDHGPLLCAMKTAVPAEPAPRGRKLSPGERKFVDTMRRWHPEIKVGVARKMFGLLLGLPRFGDEIAGSTIDTMTETEFLRWETALAIDWVLR